MDWANEKYVRLYVRDTVTWKLLPWQSKLLLPAILRKLDRSGVIDLDGYGLAAVAAVTEVPLEFVEQAMPALLAPHGPERIGVFTMDTNRLTMPNYIPAQETRQSDAQRKRDSRERRALGGDTNGHDVTSGHQRSPEVTLTPDLPQDLPRAKADPDPLARVASDTPECSCSGSGGVCLSPSLCEQAKVAAIAKDVAVKLSEIGKPSARHVLDRFAAIRAEVCGGKALFWQASPKATEKAAQWIAEMPPDGCDDIEPVFRLACKCVRDGSPDWTDPRLADPSFLLGSILSRWSGLREKLHGCSPTHRRPPRQTATVRLPTGPPPGAYADEAARDKDSARDVDNLISGLAEAKGVAR